MTRGKIALVLGFIFFFLGVITLPRYGINWDTINHLPRGQVYLHYFLTGKRDFSDLPPYKNYWQKPEDLVPDKSLSSRKGSLRSFYQNEAFSLGWLMQIDGAGHPPLSDILSSIFNRILFGRLRIINDIDSYRVYGVLLAAALVGLVYYWTGEISGKVSGFFASLSLALYPLFWAESHFNTEKDIPEAFFITAFLYCLWKGFTKKNWRWILLSGVVFGLGLGTKLNILFTVLVFLPWLVVYLGKRIVKKENLRLFFFGLVAFLLGVIIFYASWPYLWQDLIAGTLRVFGFYKLLGLTQNVDPRFVGPLGIKTYPIVWILYTTPILLLVLTLIGFWVILTNFKKDKSFASLIFILLLLMPILRVSLPGANVYGGIRQIMEFIPAMAIISGVGAGRFTDYLKRVTGDRLAIFLILIPFILLGIRLYKIHPNENIYFNELAGGLSGARAKDIPFWGNTFGGAYREAIVWINRNVETNAKLVLVYELIPNIPTLWIRPDIDFSATWRSGYLQKGEYAMTLTYQGTDTRSYYDMYLERFLDPVYEAKVDEVAVIKVWKNSAEYLKRPLTEKVVTKPKLARRDSGGVRFDLGGVQKLSRLEILYQEVPGCSDLKGGLVRISKDGENWTELPGTLPDDWRIAYLGQQPKKGRFIEPFVGQEGRFIDILISPKEACLQNIKSYSVFVFSQ